MALKAASQDWKASDHLTQNPLVPIDPAETESYNAKRNYLIRRTLASIPSDIANLFIN